MYSLALVGLVAARGAHAWGNLGHETIAYIAQAFVASETESWAQSILDDTSDSYLANVATWADTYRYTDEGAFSEPFHFIDANDDPPSSCSVDYDRDCGSSGCSVSAITNYTQRVQESSLSSTEINYALRFIVHFVGDITQPLHDEAYEYGANDVDVTFNGESTNLHHTWDTNMIDQLLHLSTETLSDAQSWASTLVTRIKSGLYEDQAAGWVAGLDINDPQTTAMTWATDANKYVCTAVMPNGASVLENEDDLYPTYYNSAIGTVEMQVAKGGYRLAKWLDAIASAQGASKRSPNAVKGVKRTVDLTGQDLLPKREMTAAQRARAARGWGCKHKH